MVTSSATKSFWLVSGAIKYVCLLPTWVVCS